MLGAIAGDIIGSTIEKLELEAFIGNKGNKEKQSRSLKERMLYLDSNYDLFPQGSKFTDDTALTVAIAYAILNNKSYALCLRDFGIKYFDIVEGFGPGFRKWVDLNRNINSEAKLIIGDSSANGSAMRVSSIGFAFDTLEKVQQEAQKSAICSHSHPEGIKGAVVVASTIFLALRGYSKEKIKRYIERNFKYNLSRKLDDIRPKYYFKMLCQNSIPEAIIAFLESNNFEDAIRKAISLGGDSDTIASITGGIAQAYYKEIPSFIEEKTRNLLDENILTIVNEFNSKYLLKKDKDREINI